MTLRYTVAVGSEPSAREAAAARLWLAGASGVWERGPDLVAWFDRRVDVPGAGRWEPEPPRDWQAEWKAGIEPVVAGDVAIVPTWLADAATEVPHVLVVDPGQAFGTGHHATTVLCLELLQDLPVAGASVLDVGTGTGVLALAAARLGAARTRGVDVDEDAVAVAHGNAQRNGVTLELSAGSVGPDDAASWDLVLANLLTDTVTRLASALVAAVRPGGHLVASGITEARAAGPVAALERAGGRIVRREARDGWVGLVVQRPAADP